MMFCANADGSHKLPLLFLGKSVAPSWLWQKPDSFQYAATSRAWMTADKLREWIGDFDRSMRAEDRHVLLLVDNAPCHNCDGVKLTNVTLEKLPPNTTAKVQPMDQGIIAYVKQAFLRRKVQLALQRICNGNTSPYQVGQLRSMIWCEKEWEGVSAETIQNCWRHSGFAEIQSRTPH